MMEGAPEMKQEASPEQEAQERLTYLYHAAKENTFDAVNGNISKEVTGEADHAKSLLEKVDQEKVAQQFFADTIGRDINNNIAAYQVYALLKGTLFADKFKELEDKRLSEGGFPPLSL